MKLQKHLISLTALVAAILLTGCRIEFDGESIVRDDGSVERTTTFKAQEASDKEEVLSHYELPKGGEWKDSAIPIFKFLKKDAVDQMLSSYEAKQIVPRGRTGVDFKRFTASKERFASNHFSVSVKDWWFVKWFTYTETFNDIIETEKIKEVLDKIFEKGITSFETELSTRIKDPELVSGLVQEVRGKYQGILTRYYDLISEKGWDFQEVDALSTEIQKEFSAEAVSKLFAEKFPKSDNEENRKLIGEAFHATEKSMEDYLNNDKELLAQNEAIFGIHGFTLFQYYDFKIKVRLPGQVRFTNGAKSPGGALDWSFSSAKLNQSLIATSRKIYPVRIMVVFFLFLLALLFIKLRSMSEPKKKKGK